MLLLTGQILQKSNKIYVNLFRKCHVYFKLNSTLNQSRRKYVDVRRYLSVESIKVKSAGKNVNENKKISEFRKLFQLAEPEKWRLMGAIALLIVSSSVTMSVPYFTGKIIDIIYTGDKIEMKNNMNKISLALLGIFLIGGICNCGRVYIMTSSGYRITQMLRKKVYSSILKQETAMFDKVSTGELVGRLTGDAHLVGSSITTNLSDGLRSGIMSLACVSMMFYISPKLACVGLLIFPPVVVLGAIYGRFVKKISKDLQDNLAVLNTTAEERISNIRVVKSFGQELNEIKYYGSKVEELLKVCYKECLAKGLFFGAAGFSGNAIALSVLYYGGVMISDETITVGSLSAFLLYAAYIGVSLNSLINFYSELNKGIGASIRLFELIERKGALPITGGKVLDKLCGNIIFENINFAYPSRNDSIILKDFNLTVPERTTMAIVGPSGSGKSTIALLLLRLYDPIDGRILLDGHNLKDFDPLWIKTQISMVSQDPILFNGTIRENIVYGNSIATEEEILRVSEQANVLEFVKKMSDGLDTIVGERGITLSGGQRQRVAIARALIKNPKILILDEATSALDAESEYFVQEALERVTQGRTVFTIAHRLSTIKNANMIAVLDKGKVEESGTYSDLIAMKDGLFKKLIKHQTFK